MKLISEIKNFLTTTEYKSFLVLLVLYFFSSFLEIFSISLIPVFISIIIDKALFEVLIDKINFFDLTFLLNYSDKQLLIFSAILIVSVFIIKSFYMILVYYLQNRFNYKIVVNKSKKIFSSYMQRDYSFHLNKNSSKLIKNLTQEIHVSVGYLSMILDLLKEILLFILIFLILLMATPIKLFLISSSLLFGVIIFYLLLKNKVTKIGQTHFKTRDLLFFVLDQSFGFIKEIKVINNIITFTKKFDTLVDKTNFQVIIIEILNKIPRLIFEFIAIAICLLIIILSFEALGSQIIPVVSLYAVCLIRLIPSYTAISSIILNSQFYLPSFRMVCGELKNSNFSTKKNSPKKIFNINYNRKASFKFKNLVFGYSKKNKALKKINFEFKANQAIGIIGPSGSGKTTLGDIFLGLYKPDSGIIIYNGRNIHQENNNWNDMVSYLPQEPFILDDNILNNIAININKKVLDNKLFDNAVKLSNCHSFVKKLTFKYNTRVGQRGIRLSGGQKKRIGIARAIYQNRPIMLLDEATSNLDPENDRIIMNSIKILKKKKTVIMITHKISNLKYFDKIIYINNGIVEKIGVPNLVINYIKKKKTLELNKLILD